MLNISQSSLSNYEVGRREIPLKVLLGVACALDVPIGELIDRRQVVVVDRSRPIEHVVREFQCQHRSCVKQ